MRTIPVALVALILVPTGVGAASTTQAKAAGLDTTKIELLTGAKGTLDAAAGVFKVMAPRTDLDLRVAGVHVTPPMGLTSWAAFERMGAGAMVMCDLVVLEDQVNPVLDVVLTTTLR